MTWAQQFGLPAGWKMTEFKSYMHIEGPADSNFVGGFPKPYDPEGRAWWQQRIREVLEERWAKCSADIASKEQEQYNTFLEGALPPQETPT